MNNQLNKILEAYKAGEKTLEETNEALKEAGANFFFDPNRNPDGGWTEKEMEEGFIEAEEPAKPLTDVSEFQTRIPALAGQTITVKTKQGIFEIRYKDDGYHAVSKLVK